MTDHTRAARLAATALDFDLTPEERAELELHRAECVRCRQMEDEFQTDAAALHGLARRDAPWQVRHTVADAAWPGGQPHRSRTGLVLLVAAILMLAMAIGGGLAASEWLRRDDGARGPTPTVAWHVSDLPIAGCLVMLIATDVSHDDLVATACLGVARLSQEM